MKHLKCRWIHEFPDEPVMLYSELDEESWERRKVEVYADGRAEFADDQTQSGDTRLGDQSVPSFDEIAADPEFEPAEISSDEFEAVWQSATMNGVVRLP